MKNLEKMVVASLVLVGACASSPNSMYAKPYALFQVDTAMSAPDTRPAWVMKIDGKDVSTRRSDPVEPGTRQVELSFTGAAGSNQGADRFNLTVDVKPCTRYYFAARRSSLTASDWKPIVRDTQPIGECMKAFNLQ